MAQDTLLEVGAEFDSDSTPDRRRIGHGTAFELEAAKEQAMAPNFLLVDDDASSRILIGAMLAESSFSIANLISVASFAEAVVESKRMDYNVILLDLNLRDFAGLDLLKRMKVLFPTTPIVVISGGGGESEIDALIAEGAEDFLEKKRIDSELLRRSIRYSIDRRKAQERLKESAYYDSLSGLANRRQLYEFSEVLFSEGKVARAALVLIDLDHFKDINDSLGHSAGDELLVTLSHRLTDATRDNDMVARLGGDEFAIVLTCVQSPLEANEIVGRILQKITEPMVVAGRELRVTASLGIAMYPDHGRDLETLLRNADMAMYSTKNAGRNGVRSYMSNMHTQIAERSELAQELRVALENNEFELYFQTQVNTDNKRPFGMESLIRWHHPERGLVSPNEFVPLLEELGLIHKVGDWILDESCRRIREIRDMGWPDMKIGINLSPSQLVHGDVTAKLTGLLKRYNLPGEAIELEITETVFIRDLAAAHRVLTKLRLLGIAIALDDFGTGFSSLSYLTQLPIDILKVDRSFIMQIGSKDEKITRAMVQLAHSLDLKAVAEGVENHKQHDFLAKEKCDRCQGYLYSKPVPFGQLKIELAKRFNRSPKNSNSSESD